MMSLHTMASGFDGFGSNGAGSPDAPQGGGEILRALRRYRKCKRRADELGRAACPWPRVNTPWTHRKHLKYKVWDSQHELAMWDVTEARGRLFGLILAANGHDPDDVGFPPCAVILGGKVIRLIPPDPTENLLNARLMVTRRQTNRS